ncbi:MAG: cupin domain-containing protein [Pseudomonadota bacterium]|nr:cupin domain-containing protein [Pseudomonadota bacterium]
MKTTATYWNPLAPEHEASWEVVDGSDGNLMQLTVAEDLVTGDYTRLTKFRDGFSTESFGAKSHDYPEEIFVVAGRLYDEAFQMWLEPGHYASRPPGEIHGPFKADGDAVVLEVSYPSQSLRPTGDSENSV